MSWAGWGDPARAAPLPEAIARMLSDGLGVTAPRPVPTSVSDLALSPVRLAPETRDELVALVGEPHARGDHEQRARHALGRSTIDLLTLRSDEPLAAPDLVLFPGSHDEILALLELCSRRRVAVVPFGGGTSVVGALTPRPTVRRERRARPAAVQRAGRVRSSSRAPRRSGRGCAARRPRRSSASAATRSATSPSRSSTRRSAGSRRRARAARRRPVTVASMSWCSGSKSRRRPAP